MHHPSHWRKDARRGRLNACLGAVPSQATSAYQDLPGPTRTYRAATGLGKSAGVVGVLEFPILQEITETTEEAENWVLNLLGCRVPALHLCSLRSPLLNLGLTRFDQV